MNQKALFIGIDDYAFAPLTSCANDAVALRDLIVALGLFASAECTVMTSPPREGGTIPTRKAILNFLLELYKSDVPLDRMLVYYAGHGLSMRLGRGAEELRTIIIPAGVQQLENAGDELIDLAELVARFARRGARQQYWIVDACRNVPEGALPNVAQIGWSLPAPGDPRDAFEMAQGVLYAVAPLGTARATGGAHGLVTGHLLDALECRDEARWGGGGWYDEGQDKWLFDLESLTDYARRRIAPTFAKGDWQLEYQLPQCWNGEHRPEPLLARPIGDRPFGIVVTPPEAAPAVRVLLKLRKQPVACWPPNINGGTVNLAPERYRIEAELIDRSGTWSPPQLPQPPVVDLRDVGQFSISIEPRAATAQTDSSLNVAPATAPASVKSVGLPPGHTFEMTPRGTPVLRGERRSDRDRRLPAFLTVQAIDPGVTVHVVRLTGGKEERDERVNTRFLLDEGMWRVEIRLGTDIIGMHEDDFAAGEDYTISANAQVTPALASLLPDPAEEAQLAATAPHRVLQPSETIGDMQGAILPTILPLLALKPLDVANQVLTSFAPRLQIPLIPQQTPTPLALALAFDGAWGDDEVVAIANATVMRAAAPGRLVWRDATSRISLFLIDEPTRSELLTLNVPGRGSASIAVPRLPNFCTSVAITIWPDARTDATISLFKMPPGSDQIVRPGRMSRALAVATRLYRAGRSIDDVDYDVFSTISAGSYGDAGLGALAWFGRARRLATDRKLSEQRRMQFEVRQNQIRDFLKGTLPQFADGRVIDALSDPDPEAALDRLLADPALPQPIMADAVSSLARRAMAIGALGHWSVARYQELASDAVFNATPLRRSMH